MAGKNEDAWTRSASGKLAGWGSVRRTRGKKIDRKRVEKEGRRKERRCGGGSLRFLYTVTRLPLPRDLKHAL